MYLDDYTGARFEYVEGTWATLVKVVNTTLYLGRVYMTVDLLLDDGTELFGYIL